MGTKKQIFAVELNLPLIARTGNKVSRSLPLDTVNLDFLCSFLLSFSTCSAIDLPAAGRADTATSSGFQGGDSNHTLPDISIYPFFIHYTFADPEVPSRALV